MHIRYSGGDLTGIHLALHLSIVQQTTCGLEMSGQARLGTGCHPCGKFSRINGRGLTRVIRFCNSQAATINPSRTNDCKWRKLHNLTKCHVLFLSPSPSNSPILQFFNHPSEHAYFFFTTAAVDTAHCSALNWSARDATSPSRDYPKPWLDYLFERCLMMFKLTNLHSTVKLGTFSCTCGIGSLK